MNYHNVKKIAVLRANALGDFIFSLPALHALRQEFPFAEIVFLGKKWHKDFLQTERSPIDRVIIVPQAPGIGEQNTYVADKTKLRQFFKKMEKEAFDVAIQLHGGGKYSNPFLLQFHAANTIGTKTEDAVDLDKTIPYEYYQNEYCRWLEVVSLIGAKVTGIMPSIKVLESDIQEARRILGNDQKKIIVIHPGASDVKRRWPLEKFARVGDYFSQKGFRVIITGKEAEKKLIAELMKRMKLAADNFCEALSLGGLSGLFSLSSLIISNDTGPLHLANAIGAKTVGIYWCGNLINGATPFRKNATALSSWITHCPICHSDSASLEQSKSSCAHQASFVAKVSVEEVIHAANILLTR